MHKGASQLAEVCEIRALDFLFFARSYAVNINESSIHSCEKRIDYSICLQYYFLSFSCVK